jgi:ribosomal protein S18 acetylase RimI-like enzyme
MKDLATVRSIVKDATRHMDEQGIPQWDEVYPSEAILKGDIQRQQMHLVEVERRTAGLVVINEDQSPEYSDVAWQYSGRVMVIHRLTIDPAFERRGLATRLMDFAEEAAACQGYACIRLDAFIQNPAAIALYENRGYRKAGIVRFRKGEFFCYEKEIRVEKPTKTSKGAADHAKKGFG